ncbi:MAG: septum formation initiator family protein [Firmicutes bacterium]|nr:septum formation initiator family protein [Bacillota bacterium]
MVLDRFGFEQSSSIEIRANAAAQARRKAPVVRAPVACLVVALVIISVGLGLTSRAARAVQSGYRIVHLKKQLATLQNENAFLEAELARIQSPSRIEEIARNKLGMAPPEEIRVAGVDQGWQAAMAVRSGEDAEVTQAASWLDVFTRIASGARTAQARPAR